jgi:plasmid stabilization system protein ParE
MDYKIFWTNEAINNLEEILNYLIKNWSQREVDNFKKSLAKQIQLIQRFPQMFPFSDNNPKLRKAVLSKQTILFYEIKENIIYLVFLFVNYQDVKKIRRF